MRKLLIGLLLLFSVLPTRGETAPRVLIIKSRDLTPYNQAQKGLVRTVQAWDQNVLIETKVLPWPEAERAEFLASIVRAKPELIVTIGTQATRAALSSIHEIPVVFSLVLTESGEEPLFPKRGPNVTGAAMDIPIPTQFSRLREVIPELGRVGVLFNPAKSEPTIVRARKAASAAGMKLVELPVGNEQQVIEEMKQLKGRIDVLWSVADSTVFTPRSVDSILLATLREGIPFVGLSPSFVRAGALLSFSCDYEDVGMQSGEMVVQVLQGKKPGQLPVAHPRRVTLFLNMNTAQAIDLDISERVQAEAQIHFEP